MLWNHRSLATFLSLTVKAHVHTVTRGQLRKPQHTYVKRAVRKAHFKMNWAFKVIQGHPYWFRQKFRTACRRNVQLMPTLFLKLASYSTALCGSFARERCNNDGANYTSVHRRVFRVKVLRGGIFAWKYLPGETFSRYRSSEGILIQGVLWYLTEVEVWTPIAKFCVR